MDSDFYRNEIVPINVITIILVGIVFPIFLGVILVLGKKNNKHKRLDF